jgi:hypothetical protein
MDRMLRWEYRKLNLNELPRRTDDIDLLNSAGATGWELVSISSINIAVLKRQVIAPPETQPTPPLATSRCSPRK